MYEIKSKRNQKQETAVVYKVVSCCVQINNSGTAMPIYWSWAIKQMNSGRWKSGFSLLEREITSKKEEGARMTSGVMN